MCIVGDWDGADTHFGDALAACAVAPALAARVNLARAAGLRRRARRPGRPEIEAREASVARTAGEVQLGHVAARLKAARPG